jgi:hypothetical protein
MVYRGPDDREYAMLIVKLQTSEDAEASSSDVAEQMAGTELTIGQIVTENYVYMGGARSKSALESFMATAPPLSADCVSDNVEYI